MASFIRFSAFLAAAMTLLAAGAASSQPSFDCTKASNPIERTICARPPLAKADRDLAATYAALLGRLSGPAKDHLAQDQVRWIGNRGRACTGGPEEIARCLDNRYGARTTSLKAMGVGQYPFVSEQAIVRTTKVARIEVTIDASYPQFDGPSADFGEVNRAFREAAREGARNAVPDKDIGRDIEQTWTYDQSFELFRPSSDAVSVATSFYTFTGGAHGSSGVFATLVDLHTGKRVLPAGVFAAGQPWQKTLTDLARADLKKQFVERPGFDDALEPAKFDELMKDPERYLFKADRLEILFNQYDVGPYAAGRYEVVIPYTRISGLFRAKGPVGGH